MKAVVFDFDGTLTPSETPIFEILEKSGVDGGVANPKFLEQIRELIAQRRLGFYEALIQTILKTISDAGFELTDENIGMGAKDRAYNPGIVEFLQALKKSGIEAYILSSGSKAYIEQTRIAPLFTEIFASTLNYNNDGRVNGIETVMTTERKAETLRELAYKLNGNEKNCSGIIYFGDGPTDIDAMSFVKECGGRTVLVYNEQPAKETVEIAEKGLVDLFTMADYSKNGEIYDYVLSKN